MEESHIQKQENKKQENKIRGTLQDNLYRIEPVTDVGCQEDAELDKILRRPRSRKFMKMLKWADVPSLQDEQLMELLQKEREKQAHGKQDDGNVQTEKVTEEELEAFRKKVEASIEKDIKEENIPTFILSPCALSGCVVHSLSQDRRQVVEHYTKQDIQQMDSRKRQAAEILMKNEQWTFIEIYKHKMVHRTADGDTIKIFET